MTTIMELRNELDALRRHIENDDVVWDDESFGRRAGQISLLEDIIERIDSDDKHILDRQGFRNE